MNTKNKLAKLALLVLLIPVAFTARSQNINKPNKMGPLGTQVNTFSGNFFLPRTDIFIPARGLDIDISFYYNGYNFDQVSTGFGNGWNLGYNTRCIDDTAGSKRIVWGEGREDLYSTLPGGGYKAPRGFYSVLTQYQPNKYLLTDPGGTKYYFDNNTYRKITKLQERNGNYINFNYSDSLLTSIVNTAGQAITFTYNAGRLASIIDAIASPTRTYNYSYDVSGNLTQVTDPLGGITKYSYLVNGPMKSVTDKNNNLVDIIYYNDFSTSELVGCNKRVSFSYDSASNTTVVTDHLTAGNQVTNYKYQTTGKLAWLSALSGNCCGYNLSFEFDADGNKIKETDANGGIYIYTYDANGNLLTMTDPLNQVSTYTYSANFNKITSYKDPKGNLYSMSYDVKGNLTQLQEPGSKNYFAVYSAGGDIISSIDPKGVVYTYTYDAYGNPSAVSSATGFAASLVNDARGNVLSVTDAKNNTHTAQYDILDRIKKVTDPMNNMMQMGYDAEGNLTSFINKNNETSLMSYDASNRIVKLANPKRYETQMSYDGMDNLTSIRNAAGSAIQFTYDSRNRMSSTKDPLGNGCTLSYDANGNITTLAFPNGERFNYSYDNVNRVTAVADGTGAITAYTYDQNNNITSMTNGTGTTSAASYDSLNRITKITDALGFSTVYGYDKNNNITSVTDRNNLTKNFTYDSLNRVKTFTDANSALISLTYDSEGNPVQAKDQNNNITTYTYDNLHRPVTSSYPDGKFIQLTYDRKDNIISKLQTDGSTITYQYDSLNRLVSRTLPGGQIFTYAYDPLGRIISAGNNNGTITLAYDALNRVTAENFNGKTIRYSYNIAARTQTIVYPDSTVITKSFDLRNRLTSISRNSNIIVSYQYNNAGQVTGKAFANGVNTTMQYDFANRMTNILTSGGSIQNTSFTYDKEMNVTSINRINAPTLSEEFSFDNTYRLTDYKRGTIGGSSTTHNTYSYDAVGNRTSINLNGSATSYTHNNLNQVTNTSGAQNTSFTYDARGNLSFDGTFYKTYDAENRLLKDSASPSSILTYQYDAFNRRIQKNINGVPYKYVFSSITPIEERDGITDNLLNRTIFSNYLTPVLNENSGTSYYLHQNNLNSVEAITNSGGSLVERYQYDAYGQPSIFNGANNPIATSATGNRFAFTGQEYDKATNRYRFYYRTYSPQEGTFDQRDPIGYGDGMGMYQYVHNNPANGIDILGLDDCPDKKRRGPIDPNEGPHPWFDFSTTTGMFGEVMNDISTSTGITTFMPKNPFASAVNTKFGPISQLATVSSVIDYAGADKGNMSFAQHVDALGGIASNASGSFGSKVPPAWQAVGAANNLVNAELKYITHGQESGLFSFIEHSYYNHWYHQAAGPDTEHELFLKYQSENRLADYFRIINKAKELQAQKDLERANQNKPKCPQDNTPGGTQNNPPKGNGTPGHTNVNQAKDPNEIVGPDGIGPKNWVSVKDRLPYTIYYENDKSASAPAKFVRITSPIELKEDATTFNLGSFGFNNQTFIVPPATASYYQRLNCIDSLGLYVDVTAGYDQINNVAFWEFQSVDPVTLLPPSSPSVGFLQLQDSSKPLYGHAFVNFSIKPVTTALTQDTIGARAKIVFDLNDTIPTNIFKNTIDAFPPVSHMNAVYTFTDTTTVKISWHANDDAGGVGVKYYSLYMSVNGGAYTLYRSQLPDTTITFKGSRDSTYCFFTTATDSVINTEALKYNCELSVTIPSGGALPITWLSFTGNKKDKHVALKWSTASEQNTKHFEIERSFTGSNFSKIGTVTAAGFSTAISNYNFIDSNALTLPTKVIYYRLKQVDRDDKFTYSIVVTIRIEQNITTPLITAFPNPFTDMITLQVIAPSATDKTNNIDIYTIQGKLVYHKAIGKQGSVTAVLSDLPVLPAGVYVLKTTVNDTVYSFKLVKQ